MKLGTSFFLAISLLCPMPASAQQVVHIVRSGDTLASIAQRYYGDPRRENVLVEENGLTTQGGAAIVVGLRLHIPSVAYHRVQQGETWAQLATRFYGDHRRTSVLMEANSGTPGMQPDVGAEIIVPFPLRFVAGQHDTLANVARDFYGDPDALSQLRRFNFIRGNRLQRGQIILVPLKDLVLSPEGRRIAEDQRTAAGVPSGDVRALQNRVNADLPRLIEYVRRGRFTEAVALGNRLLGAGALTGNQIVTIQRELGTAYVALDREDLAAEAFRAAIHWQPDLSLDTSRTSPRVLRAFERAKAPRERRTASRDAGP